MYESLLWPVLVMLLYATFIQVPLLHLREALRDYRFLLAIVVGNFLVLPLLVAALLPMLPADPALRLGMALVLLVPCTDWFITFTQLGGGNTPRAIAVTPINLLLQLVLLPLYLWLLMGEGLTGVVDVATLIPAVLIVAIPLALALPCERWFESLHARGRIRERLAVLPVPLLALVVLLIAAAQAAHVYEVAGTLLQSVIPVCILYLLLAALTARFIASLMKLPVDQGRTLAFSFGTRNSFVVLPFALTLPDGWRIAAVVIVVQSLVELLGMIFYLWWIPRRLFRQPS